jgi:hypothetical protein
MPETKRKTFVILLIFMLIAFNISAQQVRLDNLKEQYSKDNLLKMHGGVSANTVFYNGDNASHPPFTWVLSGNVNISIFNQLNLPFSFNLNNLGGDYSYPTLPNRLSLHPVYKWATAHIGDVAMAFSPYTLNGHQFTGGGVELAPDKLPLKVSAMYGRLLRATEYNPDERLNMPAYRRTGYGVKAEYTGTKYSAGMSIFSARDWEKSLQNLPDSLGLSPQGNLAASLNISLKLIKNLTFSAEYGISLLTRDLRMGDADASFFNQLTSRNPTSETFHAIRADISYQLKKNNFGFGYERIDPGYRSLGAYYFTNDLENFTLNFARPFLRDKLTLATNIGIQHDNLDNNKAEKNFRFVGALNMNYIPVEQINLSFSYSNFQTYTNVRSQFDYINEITDYDNLDTLNFTQLSQSITLNAGWNFGKSEKRKHSLGLNLSWQEAADSQNGTVRTGGASQLYNMAGTYGLILVPQNIQINAAANLTYNTVGYSNSLTYGPNLGITAKLFNKSLTAGASASYNLSHDRSSQETADRTGGGSVINLRGNLAYQLLKKHSLSLVLINQNRRMTNRPKSANVTITMSYTYGF